MRRFAASAERRKSRWEVPWENLLTCKTRSGGEPSSRCRCTEAQRASSVSHCTRRADGRCREGIQESYSWPWKDREPTSLMADILPQNVSPTVVDALVVCTDQEMLRPRTLLGGNITLTVALFPRMDKTRASTKPVHSVPVRGPKVHPHLAVSYWPLTGRSHYQTHPISTHNRQLSLVLCLTDTTDRFGPAGAGSACCSFATDTNQP